MLDLRKKIEEKGKDRGKSYSYQSKGVKSFESIETRGNDYASYVNYVDIWSRKVLTTEETPILVDTISPGQTQAVLRSTDTTVYTSTK